MKDQEEQNIVLTQYKDKNTGMVLREVFKDSHGRLDRGGKASLIDYDPTTGEIIHCVHHVKGRRHCTEGPSEYHIDPITRVVTVEWWSINDKMHRLESSLPSIVNRDPETGNVTYREYYQWGAFTKKSYRKLASPNP